MKLKLPKSLKPSVQNLSLRKSKFSKLQVTAFIAVFAIIGGVILLQSKAAGPAVWVSTTGNDTTCARNDSTKPCLTFNKAFQLAQINDIVEVACGNYGSQPLSDNPNLDTASANTYVTFQPPVGQGAPGFFNGSTGKGCVQLDDFGNIPGTFAKGPSHVQIKNMYIDGIGLGKNISNRTWDGTTTDWRFDGIATHSFVWMGVSRVQLVNSEIGDITGATTSPAYSSLTDGTMTEKQSSAESHIWCAYDSGGSLPCTTPNYDILLDNDSFHDIYRVPADGVHNACLGGMDSTIRITIRNSKFWNCDTQGVFFSYTTFATSGTPTKVSNNILFENNWVAAPTDAGGRQTCACSQALAFKSLAGQTYSNVVVRNNVIDGNTGWSTDDSNPVVASNFNFIGNLFASISGSGGFKSPTTGVNWQYNQYTSLDGSSLPGAGNVQVGALPVVSNPAPPGQASLNYDLKASVSAIDFVPASVYSQPTSFTTAFGLYDPHTVLATDIHGTSRPQGAAVDAGAYEYAPTANIWMSTTGNDSTCARGDSSKPCASLNKALSLATAGDKIQMAGGTYGSAFGCTSTPPVHEFNVAQSFTSDVTITAAAGSTVIVPCRISVSGNHVTFNGTGGTLRIDGFYAGGDNISLTNVDIYCEDNAPYPLLTVNNIDSNSPHNPAGGSHQFCTAPLRGSGNNFTMTGGSVGPTTATPGSEDSSIGYTGTPSFWTLNGVYFHDARWGIDCNGGIESCHTENLYLTGVHDFTIKNSRFEYCGNSACVFITKQSSQASAFNIFNYGNVFNHTGSPSIDYAADLSPTAQMTFAYNSVVDSSILASGGAVTMSSNIAYNNPCPGFSTTGTKSFDHNLWIYDTSTGGSADQCGATDHTYNVAHDPGLDIWVNEAGGDYHLKAGSPALDIGSISNYSVASPDYYGVTRYAGSAPDAGAAEGTGSGGGIGDTTAPTVSLTAPAGGSTVSGNVTVSANASDNVGVAGVQFKLDGNNLGSEDTSSPYTTTWNAATASNGTHTLTATARDTAGNTTTSSTITVTVTGGTNIITIGETSVLSTGDSGNANLLLAQSTTLSQSASIQSLSFYVTTAAGKLRLGIYDSTGPSGGPGALKAQTAEITPVVGWNTAVTTTTPTLSPGTYWLAYLPSDNNLAFVKNTDTSSSGKYYTYTYGALPASFLTTTTTTTSHWSFYATLNLGTPASIPGDLNNDGHVTVIDLSILLSHYGVSGTPAQGDCNNDGIINILDLSILLSHYGV